MDEDRVVITCDSEDEKIVLIGPMSHDIRRMVPKDLRHITIDIDMPEQIDRVYIELIREK